MTKRKLTLDDISDTRAYEREREDFRARIVALKKIRRVPVGPLVSLVFENRETIRFQVQEMARAERIMSDAGIEAELAAYNPLIPEPGHLSATMYLELTTRAEMEEWLPKLVGIERAVELRIDSDVVGCEVDPAHEAALSREGLTSAVHYVNFSFTPGQIERFANDPLTLAIEHPDYRHGTLLGPDTTADLLRDLLA